jgi:hypothetical protein
MRRESCVTGMRARSTLVSLSTARSSDSPEAGRSNKALPAGWAMPARPDARPALILADAPGARARALRELLQEVAAQAREDSPRARAAPRGAPAADADDAAGVAAEPRGELRAEPSLSPGGERSNSASPFDRYGSADSVGSHAGAHDQEAAGGAAAARAAPGSHGGGAPSGNEGGPDAGRRAGDARARMPVTQLSRRSAEPRSRGAGRSAPGARDAAGPETSLNEWNAAGSGGSGGLQGSGGAARRSLPRLEDVSDLAEALGIIREQVRACVRARARARASRGCALAVCTRRAAPRPRRG